MPSAIELDADAVKVQPLQRNYVGCAGLDKNPRSKIWDLRPAAVDALGPDGERLCDDDDEVVAWVEHTDHPARVRGALGGGGVRARRSARTRGAASGARHPAVIIRGISGAG